MIKVHFDKKILCCPIKITTSEKYSGQYILDNARVALKNVKKEIGMSKEWLNSGELPSGKSWHDLYDHILSRADKIHPKESMFTGLIPFVCFSKYNKESNNWLNVLAMNDNDNYQFGKGGRKKPRKRLKTEKIVFVTWRQGQSHHL